MKQPGQRGLCTAGALVAAAVTVVFATIGDGVKVTAQAGQHRLTGQPMTDSALHIGEVTIAATPGDRPPRQFPLQTVVLRADNLNTVKAHATTADATQLMGRPALRIDTNPLAWDLLITD